MLYLKTITFIALVYNSSSFPLETDEPTTAGRTLSKYIKTLKTRQENTEDVNFLTSRGFSLTEGDDQGASAEATVTRDLGAGGNESSGACVSGEFQCIPGDPTHFNKCDWGKWVKFDCATGTKCGPDNHC